MKFRIWKYVRYSFLFSSSLVTWLSIGMTSSPWNIYFFRFFFLNSYFFFFFWISFWNFLFRFSLINFLLRFGLRNFFFYLYISIFTLKYSSSMLWLLCILWHHFSDSLRTSSSFSSCSSSQLPTKSRYNAVLCTCLLMPKKLEKSNANGVVMKQYKITIYTFETYYKWLMVKGWKSSNTYTQHKSEKLKNELTRHRNSWTAWTEGNEWLWKPELEAILDPKKQ